MEPGVKDRTIYEFDAFRLVPEEDLLLRHGEPVPLNLKTFGVLKLLVERHGHLVTKSEIIDTVWEDTFIEEGSLTRAIWLIRQALGDASKERFIQTIPRRGYRFIFPVSVVTDGSGAFRLDHLLEIEREAAETVSQKSDTNGSSGEIAVDSVAAEALEKERVQQSDLDPSPFHQDRRILLSWKIYAGIATLLLTVTILYSAANWRSRSNDNHLKDRGTQNEEAYRLYQQAENLAEHRPKKNMLAALDYLNQAIMMDPTFARAWAFKAHLHAYLAQYPGEDEHEEFRKSMDAVARALEIDPNVSVAYSVRCHNKAHYENDLAGAEADCKRALELDPDSAIGHQRYSSFLRSRGRFDEAIAEAKRAVDLQPKSFDSQQNYAITLRFARRVDEEEVAWKRLLELDPEHSLIYTRLFTNLAQQGKYDKAFEYLIKRLTEVNKADNETVERFRTAYATSGWRGVTMERIKHLDLESMNGPVDVAFLYASVGDKDRAFEYLEQAIKERSSRLASLQVEPQLDPLRDDPRWTDLVRRVEDK